jgi:hypothetical protein
MHGLLGTLVKQRRFDAARRETMHANLEEISLKIG